MKNLILRNYLSPGDVVMLTAAVRDLHLCYPGQFRTDVRTPYPQLWEHNPYITTLDESDPGVEILDCHYPLIHQSNQRPYHFIHSFIEYLNEKLQLQIKPTAFRGDIYLSDQEKSWHSQVNEIVGDDRPFWIVAAGGKFDFTIKWWEVGRYQEIVDHFQNKIKFVQVGALEHHHPALRDVIDLRGKTDIRQLVRLVYHSQGVLCPVTGLMHLAAAVPASSSSASQRPCVVIAGGREPSHWEAYPHHQFIHTIGALPCCQTGGCWRSRVAPLGDGDEKDRPENLCINVVRGLPKCMDMITSDEVIRRIGIYFSGGALTYLETSKRVSKGYGEPIRWDELSRSRDLSAATAAAISEAVIKGIPDYPGHYKGRGIVICGGGQRYFTNAWVCVNMLRRLGCGLPVQLWHLGPLELDETMRCLVGKFDVECIDAHDVRRESPCRILNGWELKPYAIIHSPFREVLLIDADNLPLVKPEFLFEFEEYLRTGAIFWPDYGRLSPTREIWGVCGVSYRDEPEVESGQILVDKAKCWKALMLCLWYNANSDFYYRYVHGDKETLHMAFRKLDQLYAMPPYGIATLPCTMCQHDFSGNRIFQHRNLDKWDLRLDNRRIEGFLHEDECRAFVTELRRRWNGRIQQRKWSEKAAVVGAMLSSNAFTYHRVGYDSREMTFNRDGTIAGASDCERTWDLREDKDGVLRLQIIGHTKLTCELAEADDGTWRGKWLEHERMPIEIRLKTDPEFREDTTDRAVWETVHDQNIYGLPAQFTPDAIIVDVGAHIGAFTCACIARGAQYLYAFEPSLESFQHAQANISRCFHKHWGLRKHNPACVENVAVWRSDRHENITIGDYPLAQQATSCRDTGAATVVLAENNGVSCRSIGLDVLLHELPYVTLLKLHCEGAEWPILLTSKSLGKIDQITVQLHSIDIDPSETKAGIRPFPYPEAQNWDLRLLTNWLEEQGFRLHRICPPGAVHEPRGPYVKEMELAVFKREAKVSAFSGKPREGLG